MLDFCGGDFHKCIAWATHLNLTDALIYVALALVGIFIVLRILYWITKDVNLW